MTIWERYSETERKEYIKFLKIYGALSNLFRQKQGSPIPYLDSKFQETVYSRVFKGETVDIGNTPHDILSVFGQERIGIGLKTWMNSAPSFQKVMQLKRYRDDINYVMEQGSDYDLALKLSEIKNDRMRTDYVRLGLTEDQNIYHYVTRDAGTFKLVETSYPLVNLENLQDFKRTSSAFQWSDGDKVYKFTFADSQIWQHFSLDRKDTHELTTFNIDITADPFEFLIKAYNGLVGQYESVTDKETVEVYLPLYSYRSQKVEAKSGLNAWNAAPKSKSSNKLRPLNEVYIPIPREFHEKHPDFFVDNIFEFEHKKRQYTGKKEDRPEVRFRLHLPNGKSIPALVTQDNMKGLQSGSLTEIDPETNKHYGQSALGQWLLVDVLGLKDRTLVTREWLQKIGTDSVRLWRHKDDYENIYIDFAPSGSFDQFMQES